MPPSEQRRHPRIRRRFSLTIGVRGRSLSAVTEDLSQSGVLVRCNEILQPGTAVSGTLDLEGQALSFGAVVRWSRSASRTNSNERKHSMGLAFLSAPGARYVEYFERILGEQALAAEAARTPAGARPLPTPPVEQSAKAPPPRSTPAEPIVGAGARVPVRAAESPRRAEKAPEAQATPAPSGLVVGLVGRMESTSKPTNANLSGAVPFAPAAAALLFEQAAVQAVTGVLPAGT